MNLIVLIGSGAVGKMTVGQELMKITDYRLFHNHHMIEPVIEIFGRFDGEIINTLRNDIFEAFLKTDYSGMIFTFMWAFDEQSDWDYLKSVTDRFEATGGTVYYVELVADQAVRLERNKTENRLRNKASKRNIELSQERVLREDSRYRLVSREGEIPFPNYMKIDNTHLAPEIVARMIKERFHLADVSMKELLQRIRLEEVAEQDLPQLHAMQVESFMPLYEKYKDTDTSPATESLEKVIARAKQPNRKYYFIVKDGARVGAINIGTRPGQGEDVYIISPIFVLPAFQNQKIGFIAMQKAFEMFPQAAVWKLDTILQEEGNCHLYEKCGFVRVGEEKVINEKMTLIDYEKNRH